MARQRTLGGLVLSIGIALVVTSTDDYLRRKRKKKLEEMVKARNNPEKDIIVIEIEV